MDLYIYIYNIYIYHLYIYTIGVECWGDSSELVSQLVTLRMGKRGVGKTAGPSWVLIEITRQTTKARHE